MFFVLVRDSVCVYQPFFFFYVGGCECLCVCVCVCQSGVSVRVCFVCQ